MLEQFSDYRFKHSPEQNRRLWLLPFKELEYFTEEGGVLKALIMKPGACFTPIDLEGSSTEFEIAETIAEPELRLFEYDLNFVSKALHRRVREDYVYRLHDNAVLLYEDEQGALFLMGVKFGLQHRVFENVAKPGELYKVRHRLTGVCIQVLEVPPHFKDYLIKTKTEISSPTVNLEITTWQGQNVSLAGKGLHLVTGIRWQNTPLMFEILNPRALTFSIPGGDLRSPEPLCIETHYETLLSSFKIARKPVF